MSRFLAILLLIVASSSASLVPVAWPVLAAQEPISEPQDLYQPVDQLSTDSYSSRQRATMEMWRAREESRDRVQRAARDPDPEISGRAQWILRQWRRGSLPGTPPEVSRLLARSQGAAAISQLLVKGEFAAAMIAVEESAGTLERESIGQRIELTMQRRFPTCVHAALKNDRLPQFLEFIDAVADTKEMAVCRVQLMQQMGIDIDAEGLLPKSADGWNEVKRDRILAFVLMTLGRFDQAIGLAEGSSGEDFLYRCRLVAGRWNDAMEDAVAAARVTEVGTVVYAQRWSQAMICADRAGNNEVFQQAINALTSKELSSKELSSGEVNGDSGARDLRWRTLAIHGEIESALEILGQFDPEGAAMLSVDASRAEHAFEILEFPLDQIDGQIIQWVDTAVDMQRESNADEIGQPLNNLLTLTRCLIAVGREDAARAAVQRLCESDLTIGTTRLRYYVLSLLLRTRRSDWIVEFAIPDGEKVLSPVGRSIVSGTLSDSDSASLEVILDALRLILRQSSEPDRLAAACTLIEGEIPEGFDPVTDFKRMYDFAIAARHRTGGRRLTGLAPIRANMGVVRLFARHGQVEYAAGMLRKLVDSGDLGALLRLAEQELDAGSTDVAMRLFDTLRESVSNQGKATIFGKANGDVVTVQSLIGAWAIARRIGDRRDAEQLLNEIRLSLCSPSTRLRQSVAQYLADRDEQVLAAEVFEKLLPMVVFGNEERTGLFDVARSYCFLVSDTKVDQSARWFDLAICESVASGSYRSGAYVTLPIYVRRWLIEVAIERKDKEAIEQHLDRLMKLDPLDIDLAERILPMMSQAGFDQLAEQTLDKILDAGIRYSRQFPFDAMIANNLAWVAAINGVRLEEALLLSEQAVYQEPDSAIYRDTLAEILFRLNRKQEALQVEEACLFDDPTQWHLHKQIEKYRKAVGD